MTDHARGLRDAAIEAARSVNAETMAGLSPQEQGQLVALMQKIVYRDKTFSMRTSSE
ncbi:hypothetical protein [Croceicoccus sp. YJ47]|uniref:hypothetical protein n=1 Tax=Croceicoccus sp. YJ47 TaxID=2798724 RepID=UPI001F1B1E40|nr:hypothetical protein [Croceicoccus sp. YJ47]